MIRDSFPKHPAVKYLNLPSVCKGLRKNAGRAKTQVAIAKDAQRAAAYYQHCVERPGLSPNVLQGAEILAAVTYKVSVGHAASASLLKQAERALVKFMLAADAQHELSKYLCPGDSVGYWGAPSCLADMVNFLEHFSTHAERIGLTA